MILKGHTLKDKNVNLKHKLSEAKNCVKMSLGIYDIQRVFGFVW